MTLEELFKHGQKAAKEIFDAQGEVLPMWVAEDQDGRLAPIITPGMDDKDEIAEYVRKCLKLIGAVRFVSLLESWVVEFDKDDEIPEDGKVSNHEDRRECIFVFAEERGRQMGGMYYILRPEHGPPKLSKFEQLQDHGNEGRFVGLLEDEPNVH
jgi:hypothetical protein